MADKKKLSQESVSIRNRWNDNKYINFGKSDSKKSDEKEEPKEKSEKKETEE